MSGAATAKSRHTTPGSEEDEKTLTTEDGKTNVGVTTTEYSRPPVGVNTACSLTANRFLPCIPIVIVWLT